MEGVRGEEKVRKLSTRCTREYKLIIFEKRKNISNKYHSIIPFSPFIAYSLALSSTKRYECLQPVVVAHSPLVALDGFVASVQLFVADTLKGEKGGVSHSKEV